MKADTSITTEEEFKDFLQQMILAAQENLEQHDEVHHVIMIFGPEGIDIVAFAQIESEIRRVYKASIDQARTAAYRYTSIEILAKRAIGFVEISEAWMHHYSGNTHEEAVEEHHKLCDQYGSLAKVPGSIEQLFIRARFRDNSVMHTYKIGRRNNKPYLYDHEEDWKTATEGTRAEALDKAIDTVIEAEKK